MVADSHELTAIAGGINRLRTRASADPHSLYNLTNGYVTQAGTVKVRPGTLRNANIAQYAGAGKTKGLVAYQDQFHIFSSQVVPIPPDYALHVLSYPKLSSLTQVITSIPPAGDPSWANVSYLVTCDGANGGTGFTDLSNSGHPVITSGNAHVSTTTPKFGTGAALFPDTSSTPKSAIYSAITPAGDLDVLAGTGDYTIELWFRTVTNNSSALIVLDYGGSFPSFTSGKKVSIQASIGNTAISAFPGVPGWSGLTSGALAAGGVITIGTWYHLALVRSGGNTLMYLNGVPGASLANWINYPSFVGQCATFGLTSDLTGGTDPGEVDEIRVTKGVARYTAPFTPPVAPFPAPTFTVASPQLKEIHFAAPYLGGLYVVAEFDVSDAIAAQFGSVFHYWIQSSTGGDNSNFWQKSTDYVIGDVVIPTSPNGLIYTAARKDPANPVWTPTTAEALANVVEPTVANGFKYTVTLVEGAAPTTGTSEPVWPTANGATVDENSALQNDQSFAVATAAPAAAPPVPTRYQNNGGVF